MTLFLCFYGDSAHWDNLLLIPGYPSGHSYLRPFRYRDAWIQKSLLTEIQNKQACEKLIGSQAILCIRFLLDHNKWTVLPIRKVVIRYVDPMPENQSVYFSMGPLYDFTKVEELSDICLDIDESERDAIGEKVLFFRSNLDFTIAECESDMIEDAAWASFVNLIASEKKLPLKEEAKKALFIRFQGLGGKQPAKKGTIYKSWSKGEIHGTILTEGLSYELVFYHRVPSLIGQDISIKKSLIKYSAPTGNIELSRSQEHLTGNYQKHVLNISARKPSGTSEEIIIELPKQIKSQGEKTVYTTNFYIPLKVKISHWHRFKQIYLWLFIVWVSLFLNVIVKYLLDGKTDWNLIIISAIIALLSAIGVYMLQHRGNTK